MKKSRVIIYGIISILVVVFLIISFTYGYVSGNIKGNTNSNSVEVDLETSRVLFTDLSTSQNKLIEPGFIDIKVFTIKNIGNTSITYNIYLSDVVNDFARPQDLVYTLYRKSGDNTIDTSNLDSNDIIATGQYPRTDSYIKVNEILADQNDIYTYALKVEYINSVENQDANKGKVFSGKIQIDSGIHNYFGETTLAYHILDSALNVTSEQKALNYAEFVTSPKTTPAQAISSRKYEKTDNFQYVETQSNITTTNIYTYASDYTQNDENKLSLDSPASGDYASIYTSLPGKYIVSKTGSTGVETSSNLTTLYKVISTSTNSMVVGVVSRIVASENELSITSEAGGYSYYFRGGVKNNYVNFNNMCWRIVRIDRDGGIRLILASNNTCSSSNLTYNSGFLRVGNTMQSKFYGYTLKSIVTSTGESKDFYTAKFLNNNTNAVRVTLENWLTNNFNTNNLKETTWCLGNSEDAFNTSGVKYALTSNMNDGAGNPYTEIKDYLRGYGIQYYYYNGLRLSGYGTTKHASLECNSENEETYKSYIGLLTSDEVTFAGSLETTANYTIYLTDNAKTDTWGLYTPKYFNGGYAYDYCYVTTSAGRIESRAVSQGTKIRPVITLKVGINYISGDGTVDSPYVVEES